MSLTLRFWGVRGSVPTPQKSHLGYGGNTTCLELHTGGESIVIDAGTGIHSLGRTMQSPSETHLFLTHFHWDHVQGLPYFAPLYDPASSISVYTSQPADTARELLSAQTRSPFFPVPIEGAASRRDYIALGTATRQVGEATVRAFPVHHPQGASGFRIECGRRSVVFVPDREHGHPTLDQVLVENAQGTDVLILDAQYTPEEYERFRGWGHSTWREAAAVARSCGAKQLILFHHHPDHDDDEVDQIVAAARGEFANTTAAREGVELSLSDCAET